MSDRQYYLFHFKGCYNCFDENSPSDGSTRHANIVLGQVEDNVPQTRLEVGLHLWQVEVRPRPYVHQLLCVVEEVEAEILETCGNGFAIDCEVLLYQQGSRRL